MERFRHAKRAKKDLLEKKRLRLQIAYHNNSEAGAAPNSKPSSPNPKHPSEAIRTPAGFTLRMHQSPEISSAPDPDTHETHQPPDQTHRNPNPGTNDQQQHTSAPPPARRESHSRHRPSVHSRIMMSDPEQTHSRAAWHSSEPSEGTADQSFALFEEKLAKLSPVRGKRSVFFDKAAGMRRAHFSGAGLSPEKELSRSTMSVLPVYKCACLSQFYGGKSSKKQQKVSDTLSKRCAVLVLGDSAGLDLEGVISRSKLPRVIVDDSRKAANYPPWYKHLISPKTNDTPSHFMVCIDGIGPQPEKLVQFAKNYCAKRLRKYGYLSKLIDFHNMIELLSERSLHVSSRARLRSAIAGVRGVLH